MSPRTGLAMAFLLASVAVAGLAASGVWLLADGFQAQLVDLRDNTPIDIEVVVAAREIPAGHTIVEDDLRVWPLRDEFVPVEAITRPDLLVGRVAMERVLSGDLIREERLAQPESGSGLNAIIPEGLRALSFNIDGADQVSGFLLPGNRVDVITTLFGDDGQLLETRTLLQGVAVLTVNDRTHEGRRLGVKLKPQITVAVAPDDAERITHVFRTGLVRLSMRGDTDLAWFGTRGTLTTDLLGREGAISIAQWYAQAGLERPKLYRIHGSKVEVEGG